MIRSGETARGKRRGSWLMSENGENWENSVQGLSVPTLSTTLPTECCPVLVSWSSLGLLDSPSERPLLRIVLRLQGPSENTNSS